MTCRTAVRELSRAVARVVGPAIVVVGFGGAAFAAPPNCTVPGDHATIQAAINNPACTTITVAPGVYAENLTIGRAVTLNGAQAGVPGPGRSGAESVIAGPSSNGVIQITAADVTIDGFTINNPGTADANRLGILVKTAGNNAVIRNNIIDQIGAAGNANFGGSHGIYLELGPDGSRISDNAFSNIRHAERSSSAILIGDSSSTNPSQDVRIERNSVSNVTTGLRGAYGFLINNGASATGGGTPGLRIRDNSIDNLNGGGWAHAIGLEGSTPNAIVFRNTIKNVTDLTPSPAPDAVAVFFQSNPTFTTAAVVDNNYDDGVPIGMALHPTMPAGTAEGRCNWWNDSSGPSGAGPGTGAAVGPNVAYAPWLLSPAPYGACGGGLEEKDCRKAVQLARKLFEDSQHDAKRDFEDEQKADKQAFDAQPHTAAEKKAFQDQQKAEKRTFEDDQKADKQAFEQQNKADEATCKS